MVDSRLLLSEIIKKGYTRKSFCEKIGMPQSTFCRRLKRGDFRTQEAFRIMGVLELDNPDEIFFAKELTQ